MTLKLRHSVVLVNSGDKTGSGFLIEGGFMLTAAHNLDPEEKRDRFFICGQDHIFDIPVKAEMLKIWSKAKGDIALFKLIHPVDIPYLNDRMLRLGDERNCIGKGVKTVGFPSGKGLNGVPYNSSRIDSLDSAHSGGFPQMTLSDPGNISAGYSGGVIFSEGKVLGMILEKGYELVVGIPVSFIKKKIAPFIASTVVSPPPTTPKPPKQLDIIPLPDGFSDKIPPAPYPGLKPFTKNEARIFFGRDRDIATIYNFVTKASEPITLLFGQSGVGKSSLLFAGLFPRLDTQWEVHYCRRDKDIGLSEQLKNLIDDNPPGARPHLFILDQVEEMFTNPLKTKKNEAVFFVRKLRKLLRAGDKFILGFRSEYFAQIEDLLIYEELTFNEHFLKPLDKEGIINAIKKPTDLFSSLEIERYLPEDIAKSVLENEASHIAPVFQIQMKKLYELAKKEDHNEPYITEELYNRSWKKTLDELLAEQLNSLPLQQWNDNGLALDLLQRFTTQQATATSLEEQELKQQYGHIPGFDDLILHLKKLELLCHKKDLRTDDQPDTAAKPSIRLTHDALAPLIRKRYHDSDAAAQRAWRLVESKQPDIAKGEKVGFDQYDIETIEKGRPYMQAIPKNVDSAILESEKEITKRQTELRDKTAFIFDTLQKGAHTHIYEIEHSEAIEKFRAAMGVDVPVQIKQEKLADDLKELAFFFAHSGAADNARAAIEIFKNLPAKNEIQAQGIEKCLKEAWTDPQQLNQLIKAFDPAFFEKMTHRYYPKMIDIQGGDFRMGKGDDSDNPIHKVRLDDFALAQTPTTYWQFGMHCAATGKNMLQHSPPWGRKGDHPLVLVQWYEAIEYLNWLNETKGLPKAYTIDKDNKDPGSHSAYDYLKWIVERQQDSKACCLPTEAQWEYAAMGGHLAPKDKKGIHSAPFAYAGSDDPDKVAWFDKNTEGQTQPVIHQSKQANALGLHSMSGNAFEWCWDWYGINYYKACEKEGKVLNPMGQKESEKDDRNAGRVVRGGSYYSGSGYCGVAFRFRYSPDYRNYNMGFRVAQGY